MEPAESPVVAAEAPELEQEEVLAVGENNEGDVDSESEVLISKAQKFMETIVSSPENPNPKVLHGLASLLETQELRYMEEADHSLCKNSRASHNIGRLGSLIRENDEFFDLISSTFLSESRYSIAVQAATLRVLLSISLTWMYPHVFEDDVLENIRNWVLDDGSGHSSGNGIWKRLFGDKKSSDLDMRKIYATGLLAVCLTSGSQVVEDVLTSGVSAKLMHYLRNRVLGETSTYKKMTTHVVESKNVLFSSGRGKEESRPRSRQTLKPPSLDYSRKLEDGGIADEYDQRDHERNMNRLTRGEEHWVNGEPPHELDEEVHICEADVDGENWRHGGDMHDGKLKEEINDPSDDDFDEKLTGDASRSRTQFEWTKHRGKTAVSESSLGSEKPLMSPGSESRGGLIHSVREKCLTRSSIRKQMMNKRSSSIKIAEGSLIERDDTDECFQECRVGTKDITDLVKSAVRAAEVEARTANAPIEAVKAAGDAAAELVKGAAMDEFKASNNEEAAVLAASKAASTVIDAANTIEKWRNSDSISAEPETNEDATVPEMEDVVEFFIPDNDSLAQQREKFCIQCLQTLGEYVEVLGPVLHEKGIDVCLALLQQYSKVKKESEIITLLPDVLKMISALAAHRKFAAVFVDRGGIQKLLAVPRGLLTFFGLSSCLLTIGSLQGIMERVCALPSDVIHQLVELGAQLLECAQDMARKNAALFFSAAFVFRAIVDAFDAQDGLQKTLRLLHNAASVRSGVTSVALTASTSGAPRNDRSNAEVLTSSEKQIAYHTCVTLRQYFRAQLLLLVDSVRVNKSNRSATRNIPSLRSGYKPFDLSDEAMDAVFIQIQKDRKLGPALVRTRWPAVERFLACNGHLTMLELCQAPPVERYLHDLLQYALGILHIVTLVPYSRKLIINATLSNDRVGIAVVLDAANGPGHLDPDIIQQALNVLINLVCPPPSISNRSSLLVQGSSAPGMEATDKITERNVSDQAITIPSQLESRERNGESRTGDKSSSANKMMQSSASRLAPGLVGDRRISLGVGAGSAGLAAQLEQGYCQARDAVRSNNGIKVLLQLMQTRVVMPPATLDCLRALACRVMLGLARDDTIAHILTKLQVGKKLSELIRDIGSQIPGTEQNRWQTEMTQAAIELISIVTSAGRASTLAATDAAIPTLRRIERANIAAGTPITYHPRELLLLVQEHLQASGLSSSAATLLKEAQLTPLPSLSASSPLAYHAPIEETPFMQSKWPSVRSVGGFLSNRLNMTEQIDDHLKCYSTSSVKKSLVLSSSLSSRSKGCFLSTEKKTPSTSKAHHSFKKALTAAVPPETPLESASEFASDVEINAKTPIVLSMKRKLTELKEVSQTPASKALCTSEHRLKSPIFQTPNSSRKGRLLNDVHGFFTPSSSVGDSYLRQAPFSFRADSIGDNQNIDSSLGSSHQYPLGDVQPANSERLSLDSIVVNYLKQQHRQCPAPITTLPPLSLLHPHVCPERRRNLDEPSNVTARLGCREFKSMYSGVHGSRRDRQFIYSRFRLLRTCKDDASTLLTCMTFLGDSSQIAVGSHSGELKIFDTDTGNVLESCMSHEAPLILVQSYETKLVLSSSSLDVKLWDASSISVGPIQSFEGCRAARFGNTGTSFAALPTERSQREVLLYDVQTQQLDRKLSNTSSGSSGRGHASSLVHFSPLDEMLLWNGVLWDTRASAPVHRFDQFTDYGGGGFHPSGNEVIINSEVWDLRKFSLLRSVPSLDQTVITFNNSGDVIYAILRRNLDDIMAAVNTRRSKHPLFASFLTVDATNYSDIATTSVDRCVVDFATETYNNAVGLVTMDEQGEMFSSARIYEIGRRRPNDDDSDPEDIESEEEDEEDDDDLDLNPLLGPLLDGDSDSDSDGSGTHLDDDDDDDGDDDEDGDFFGNDMGLNAGVGMSDTGSEGDEEDDDSSIWEAVSSGDEDFF